MSDPGLALKASTLSRALGVLAPGATSAPGESVEDAAAHVGLRARRVILDGSWWEDAAFPMLARIDDRREKPRPDDSPAPDAETGWVALIPGRRGGYRIVAVDASGAGQVAWTVDAAIASRLTPFAFTLHRGFGPEPLTTRGVLRFAWQHDRGDLAGVFATGLAAALLGLLTPLATGALIDRAIPSGSSALIAQLLAGLAFAGLALIALEMLRTYAVLRFESRTGLAVQAAVLDRVLGAQAAFFRDFASGDLSLRVGAIGTVQRSIAGSAIATFVAIIFVAANLGLLFWYSPKMALASMGLVVLAAAVPIIAGLARLKLGRAIEALDGRLGALAFEYLAGVAKLRAAAAEAGAFANWIGAYRDRRRLNRRSAGYANWESVAMSLLQPAAAILIYALAWNQAQTNRGAGLSTGEFIAFQTALFALLGGVQMIVGTAMDVLRLKPLWERARPVLEAIAERPDASGFRHEPQGAISLEGIHFAYPGGPDVLRGIDLKIEPGEFVALVGASGSGKSTLLRLLLGFEVPARGTVRYDGLDLATLDLRRLRRGIGSVLQGGTLWAGDLYTNIAGASMVDVSVAMEAARLAGIAADIEALPMGLYTHVGEGVSTLSGGQRQRVLIARALVGKPRVLLLDEATSALDALAQATVLEGLAAIKATRVVIAHRLETVRGADRIVVLDSGRIAQVGTYGELARQAGPFANLLGRGATPG